MTAPDWKQLLRDILADKRVPAPLRKRAEALLAPKEIGRPPSYSADQVAEIVRLKSNGQTWDAIASLTGIPRGTCRQLERDSRQKK